MEEAVSILPVTEHMPQEHFRNIWNGTVTGSVSGLIRLELTQVRLLMQYLPPAGLNNNPTEACMGLLKLAEKYSPEKLEQVCAKALSLFR